MECSKGFWVMLLLILLCFLAVPLHFGSFRVHIAPRFAEDLFRNFTKKYNKSYERPEEFQKRLNIFTIALEDIVRLNTMHNATAHYGVTKYSDLTEDEFMALHLNQNISRIVGARLKSIKQKPKNNVTTANPIHVVSDVDQYRFTDDVDDDGKYRLFYKEKLLAQNLNYIPLKMDWRTENVLSPVRKQGKCGACWAYSVIAMIEANLAIHKSINESLSIQQLVDCARNGNDGCKGGDTCLLLEWLTRDKINIRTEDEYPLSNSDQNLTCKVSEQNDNCVVNKCVRVTDFTCNSFIDDEVKILEIVANYGPVAVAVNALPWQHYVGGIVDGNCDGDADHLNHAAEIIGYNRSGDVPYYIVQNSWGQDFGENGYVRVAFGKNICGIASQVSLVRV